MCTGPTLSLLLFPEPLPQPQTLQKLKVPIIDSELCKRLYWRGAGQEAITEDMLCAGYLEGERDACLVRAHPLSTPTGRPKSSIVSMLPPSESPEEQPLPPLPGPPFPWLCRSFSCLQKGLCTEPRCCDTSAWQLVFRGEPGGSELLSSGDRLMTE